MLSTFGGLSRIARSLVDLRKNAFKYLLQLFGVGGRLVVVRTLGALTEVPAPTIVGSVGVVAGNSVHELVFL